MRLSDLNPRWVTPLHWSAPSPFYVGASFLCPHCDANAPLHGPNRRRRLVVMFWPPIDPDQWLSRITPIPHDDAHTRTAGDTFDTLTITPSIGFDQIGHWHGHIIAGAII